MEYDKLNNTLKANGTSLKGKVETTFDRLEEAFGEPIYPDSFDQKVICEWVLEFEDGLIATIYCWKVKSVPLGEYDWHIGGHSERVVDYVKNILLMKRVEYTLNEDEQVQLADGFEDAFIGIARQFGKPIAVYDREKCIDILVNRDGMSPEEAEEYFQFNVEGAWVGENTPAFLEK
jgi:hypothetical protein